MKISAPKFNGEIPLKYTCDGEDINPPINVENIPEDAEVLAIVVDDPDAPGGVFDHWIAWNLPLKDISEGEELGTQGRNDFGVLGYKGPCPPGETHRYRFKVYALSQKLDLSEGASKVELERAIKGKVLAKDVVEAKYGR